MCVYMYKYVYMCIYLLTYMCIDNFFSELLGEYIVDVSVHFLKWGAFSHNQNRIIKIRINYSN